MKAPLHSRLYKPSAKQNVVLRTATGRRPEATEMIAVDLTACSSEDTARRALMTRLRQHSINLMLPKEHLRYLTRPRDNRHGASTQQQRTHHRQRRPSIVPPQCHRNSKTASSGSDVASAHHVAARASTSAYMQPVLAGSTTSIVKLICNDTPNDAMIPNQSSTTVPTLARITAHGMDRMVYLGQIRSAITFTTSTSCHETPLID